MGRMKKKEKKKREEGGRRGYLYPGGLERVWRVRKYPCTWGVLQGTPHFSTSPLQLSAP
jgi:hypothetical protein